MNNHHIDLTLIQQEKHNQQPHLQNIDSKNFETNIQTILPFYTDKSRIVDGTGAAGTNIPNLKQIRLPNIASI